MLKRSRQVCLWNFPLSGSGTTPAFWTCFKKHTRPGTDTVAEKTQCGDHGLNMMQTNITVKEKPPLPPERAMSPGLTRRSLRSPPPPTRCLSPERLTAAVVPRPSSPQPEAEIAKILSFDMPPKRNSVVSFESDDSQIFRPIHPSPITGFSEETRPMSPTPRPFSPIPEWFDDDLLLDSSSSPAPSLPSSPPPQQGSSCSQSPPPQQNSPTAQPPSQLNNNNSASSPKCQPTLVVRIAHRERKRPVSAPGMGLVGRGAGSCRPTSPPARGSRPRSAAADTSRFVKYRSFQDDRYEEFLRKKKERRPPPQVLVEPKWQVMMLLMLNHEQCCIFPDFKGTRLNFAHSYIYQFKV